MSTEDKRNNLIVELSLHSSLTIQQLQAKPTTGSLSSLTGMTAIFYFLYTNNIRSIDDLRSMSDHDQRNTLIADLHNKFNKDVSELQGMNDNQLVASGADFYRNEVSRTIFVRTKWLVLCTYGAFFCFMFEFISKELTKDDYLRNEFNFWNVHEIMNASGLLRMSSMFEAYYTGK